MNELIRRPVLDPAEVKAMIAENPRTRLLDVRTPGEYETAHIQGAYNVPLESLGEHAAEIRAHVGEPVILVCQSGTRARKAEEALQAAGMPDLHVLDGGVNGWVAAGEPVLRGARRLSLERQVRIAAGGLAAVGGLLALTVNPLFAIIPTFVGGGLFQAGVTDSCLLGMALTKLPYNRPASCDVVAMVAALASGSAPVAPGRGERSARATAPACAGG